MNNMTRKMMKALLLICISGIMVGCNTKEQVSETEIEKRPDTLNIEPQTKEEAGIQQEQKVDDRVQLEVNELHAGMPEGENWSIYVRSLEDEKLGISGNSTMQAASLIKLFVAGTVFEEKEMLQGIEDYPGETENLVSIMLSKSDNEATNALIKKLGNTDAATGMDMVNTFCQSRGYTKTHLGRLMLDFQATDDNYTSVNDCGMFLEDIYSGRLKGAEFILEYLKAQERTEKIPAGVPVGIDTANKTGELNSVENDAAIVWGEKETYILCVMSENLTDASRARTGESFKFCVNRKN